MIVSEPFLFWAKVLLRLGLVLLAIGLIPLAVVEFIIPQFDSPLPALLAFVVAPLGSVVVVVAAILFLAALLRRPRGSS